MGGLLPFLPLTLSYFGVGFGALLGLPGTSGFYSKEAILELAATGGGVAPLCQLLLLGALVCTAYYSLRTLTYAFGGSFRGGRGGWAAVTAAGRSELPPPVVGALGVLVVATLGGETLLHPYLGGGGGAFLRSAGVALDPTASFGEGVASPHRWLPLAAMGVGFGAFGMAEALAPWWGSAFATPAAQRLRGVLTFLQRGWYLDGASSTALFTLLRPLAGASLTLEKGVLEWVGPTGLERLVGRGQRWLDLANVGRSLFSTLGLVVVAYGLLLAYALGGGGGAFKPFN
jgi:NADH:ubiquinone oxidoreductase subunit 5 (subunit L)/multisubunit Na+/H+ antiporter MnhA subunit